MTNKLHGYEAIAYATEPARIEIWIDADRVVDGWGSALGARRVCVSRLSAPEREALERGALGLENAPPAGGRGRGSSYRRIVKIGDSYFARRFSPEQEAAEGIAD